MNLLSVLRDEPNFLPLMSLTVVAVEIVKYRFSV